MFVKILVGVLLCLLLLSVGSLSQAQLANLVTCKSRQVASLRDYMTSSWLISERQGVKGAISCSLLCVRQKLCVSFLYNDVINDCRLFAVVKTTEDMTSSAIGYRYYDTCRAQGFYGDSCSADGECGLTKTRCFNARCRCEEGYSFDPHQVKCVTHCGSYGLEFEAVPGYFIDGNTEEAVLGNDTAACMLRCRQATAYVCRSIDVRLAPDPACAMASVVKADVTASVWRLGASVGWTTVFYQRHCAL